MNTLFLLCAVVGGSVLVLQTILLVFGAGMDSDLDADGDFDALDGADSALDVADAHESFVQVLSFKTVVAFLTFFGLVGLACEQAEMTPAWTLSLAIGAGLIAVYIVAWLMAGLARLQSKGNLELSNAVGCRGTVYLRVPAQQSGVGRVTVAVQGRTVECKAVTAGAELATGTTVVVRALAAADTLEVAAPSS